MKSDEADGHRYGRGGPGPAPGSVSKAVAQSAGVAHEKPQDGSGAAVTPERHDHSLARQLVRTGGTFGSLIAGILIAAGQANVDGVTTRWALVVLCFIAAMTFYAVGRKR